MKRTDEHCPSKINPQDYQFVAFEHIKMYPGDLGACQYQMAQRAIIRNHMAQTGGNYSHHEHGGNCMVCGNVLAMYTILFYHEKSNTYVRMGDICATKVECAFDNSEFNRFKNQVNGWRKAIAGKNKAMHTLFEQGFEDAWDLYDDRNDKWSNYHYEEQTICEIVGKLVQYGSITGNQMSFIGRLLVQIKTRDERLAERRRKEEAAAPVPETEDRIKIVGTVVGCYYDNDSMFPGPRMIVETKDGWTATGTRPAGIEKGQMIEFMARIVISKTNTKKGYFKRPTKVVVIAQAPVAEELVAQ